MRPKYHQSALEMYLKCGMSYEFRFILGIICPPTAALTVGSSVDHAVTANLIEKVSTAKDMPLEQVLDAYSGAFDLRATETEWDEDEDPGKQKDMGAQLVRLHHEKLAPTIAPATVQEEFVIETDAGYDLGGTIDLTEHDDTIADTKTSKTKYADDAASRELQPALYDFAFEALKKRKAKQWRYDVLVKPTKTKPPEAQQICAQITADDRAWLFRTVDQVHRGIQAGIALPAAKGAWWCSKGWCGYSRVCPKFQGSR
jgi:hypothetical protein